MYLSLRFSEFKFKLENVREEKKIPTWFNRTMNMVPSLIVDPIESSFNSKLGQHTVFGTIAVRCRNVNGTSFIMKIITGQVHVSIIPAFNHPQSHARPLIHHRYRQIVQFLFAPLEIKTKNKLITQKPVDRFDWKWESFVLLSIGSTYPNFISLTCKLFQKFDIFHLNNLTTDLAESWRPTMEISLKKQSFADYELRFNPVVPIVTVHISKADVSIVDL